MRLLSEREQPFGGAAAQFALLRGVVRDRRSDMQTMFGDVYRCFDGM